MRSITSENVIAVLIRALNSIDDRLVDHGQRVAYTLYKMLKLDGSYSERDMQEICILAMLHDIGAYKTEEIDNMAQFESEKIWQHSIYGYLFIKNMTPLKKWADAVLYHHMNYNKLKKTLAENEKLACMLYVIDRMDLRHKDNTINTDLLKKYQNNKFDPEIIQLYITANEKFEIEKHIKDNSYLDEIFQFVIKIDYDEETLFDFIRMIAYTIDFRSETTVNHVITTASISVELGKLSGLGQDELKRIFVAAYLHDIGKISTPLEILEKPGALTNGEMEVMKNHIIMTGNILENRVSDEIFKIAFRHHEMLDGKGYPNQLTGEEINLSERIVAVSDIISALTGKRSYKDSFNKETVIAILKKQGCKGKLCDLVVNTAIDNYDKIIANTEMNCKKILSIYYSIQREYAEILNRFTILNETDIK